MKKQIALAMAVPVLLSAIPAFAANMTHQTNVHMNQPVSLIEQQIVTPVNALQTAPSLSEGVVLEHKMTTKMGQKMIEKTGIQFVGQNPELDQWFAEAQWDLVQKRYPEAIVKFEKALTVQPEDVRLINGLSTALMARGEFETALVKINRAIVIDPVSPELLYTKAQILDSLHRDVEALDFYLGALNLEQVQGHIGLDTRTLEIQRRVTELFSQVQPQLTAIEKDYFMGQMMLSLDKPFHAAELLNNVVANVSTLENNERINRAYVGLGLAYELIGNHTKAIATLNTLTKEQPESPVAFYRLHDSYIKVGKTMEAQKSWEKFAEFAPKSQALFVGQPEASFGSNIKVNTQIRR